MIDLKIEDGIVVANFPKSLVLDLNTARKIVAERLKLQGGKSTPLLVLVNNLNSDGKAVRAFMAIEGSEGISQVAYVVNTAKEKAVINYFLNIDEPKIPSHIFFNKEDAIKWIKSFI